jgi:hypothetical protein
VRSPTAANGLELRANCGNRIPFGAPIVVPAMETMNSNVVRSPGWLGLVALAVGACSGNGTLSLRLTDAPPDLTTLGTVTITLARVEAHFAGGEHDDEIATDAGTKADDESGKDKDSGWQSVLSTPRSFDLLKLQNDVTTTLGELSLPPGKITQLRLFIDPHGPNDITLKSGQMCSLDLREVDQTGVKIVHPFKITSGKTTDVVLDFDVKESVQMDGPCVFRLSPVIKVKSVKD